MDKYEVKHQGGFDFVEEGEGEVLLLLHGLFGQLSNYNGMIEFFSPSFRVVVPALPLYALPVGDTHLQSMADFVDRFIRFRGYRDIILVGNSMGGHVGLIYTVDNPVKIRLLALTGSSGLYENSFGEGYPRRGDYAYIERKVRITFYNPAMATKDLVDECFELINDRNRLIRILALAKSAIRHNMAKDLPNINQPACLIWGRNDIITPPEVAQEFERLMPHADLFWIDYCGHAPMMEHPEEFNRVLNQWLLKQMNNGH